MKRALVLCALAVLGQTRAEADTVADGRWTVSLQGGVDLALSGDFLGPGSGAIAGLPVSTGALSYGTAFGRPFHGAVSIGRRLTPRTEVFLRGGRAVADGRSTAIGSAAGLDLTATPGRHEEWTVEAGARFLARGAGAWRPYLAIAAGAARLSAVSLHLAVPDARLQTDDLPLYDRSTVGVASAGAGVLRRLAPHLWLGVDAAVRYETAPKGLDAGLRGSGLETINDGGSRVSLPVSVRLDLTF